MVLRRVCCREGLSRSLLVRTARRFPSRARSACGGSSLTRAAASSMASGNPSRWAQISATARAFALVTWKSGLTAWAREMKRATASYCDNATRSGTCVGLGTANGGIANSCSPRTCRTNRLVTSTLSLGQAARRSAKCSAAPSTCSKLSNSSKSCLSCRDACSRSCSGCPPVSLRPSVWAMAGTTNVESLMGARFTKKTPSAKRSLNSAATCKPKRVLPAPPGPVRVSRRTSSRRSSC